MEAADGYDRRDARLRLGNIASLREETRAVGIVEWIDSTVRDARHGVRQMIRTPALTLAVLASLAVGVGANTAIFNLVDAAILRPLPVVDPQALRVVEWTNEGFPPGATNINGDFRRLAGEQRQGSSVPAHLYRRLAREQTAFALLVGIADPDDAAVALEGGIAEQMSLQYVSANFFQGIGAAPVLGRPFLHDEDRVGGEPVVVVSHRFWRSRLGGATDALERTVRVNHVPARIVGVAPPEFFGVMVGQWTDVYAPLAARVAFAPPPEGAPRAEDGSDWWVRQIGRLPQGVTEGAARGELDRLFRSMSVPPDTPAAKTPAIVTMPGVRGIAAVSARDRNALWMLMLLVGVLMLLVCANVANLLLARGVGRQRESAVRLALGAARTRLFRQHLVESAVFAIVGGGIGLALGVELAYLIHRVFQVERSASSAFDLRLDPRLMVYAGALSIVTAFLFGLAPAVRSARADVGTALRVQTRSAAGCGSRASWSPSRSRCASRRSWPRDCWDVRWPT
jgi:predicted permease